MSVLGANFKFSRRRPLKGTDFIEYLWFTAYLQLLNKTRFGRNSDLQIINQK